MTYIRGKWKMEHKK
jgi:hypothetical protein